MKYPLFNLPVWDYRGDDGAEGWLKCSFIHLLANLGNLSIFGDGERSVSGSLTAGRASGERGHFRQSADVYDC